jgi:hypothetical protein
MTFNFQTFGGGRAKKFAMLAIVFLFVWVFYCLKRSSAERISKSQTQQTARASEQHRSPALHITSVTQHGRIFEINGSTDPGAVVMINGQSSPTLFDGNSFRHFIGPLPTGTSIVTITAQDSEGGVNTQQMAFATK